MTSVMLRHPYIRYRREVLSFGGSKVIRGIIARKEGEPGNEARCECFQEILPSEMENYLLSWLSQIIF